MLANDLAYSVLVAVCPPLTNNLNVYAKPGKLKFPKDTINVQIRVCP